jgi:hypothetical protein
MHKDTRLPSRKDFKIITNLPFSFLLQFLDYYMMILKLSIYRKEIERDRLEMTSVMLMTPKGYEMNGIGIWMEYNEIEPL